MSKTVLITGATGFIGANLARHCLTRGDRVHILSRKGSNVWRIRPLLSRLKIHYTDIAHTPHVTKVINHINPNLIYNFASYGAYPLQADVSKMISTNILGTINILKAATRLDRLDIFIHTGSSTEYGFKSHPMREDNFLEPITAYGVAKASQTLWCQFFAKMYSLPVIVIRPSLVYGYYEEPTRLIPSTIISHLRSQTLVLSTPFPKKDFVFIEDVIEAIEKLTHSRKFTGQIFNIASGKEYSVGEVVFLIRRLMKKSIPYRWGGRERRNWDTDMSWVDDVQKAKRLLGWGAKHSFEKGLLKSIEWFKKNKDLYP